MMARSAKALLAVSLALNVFLVGAGAGGAYMWFHTKPDRPAARGLAAAARTLTPDQRKAFRQSLKASRKNVDGQVAAGQASRAELARLMSQPVLDRSAIDAALADARNADMALRENVEGTVVDFAAGLSPDDRAKLVEGLSARGQMLRGTQKN